MTNSLGVLGVLWVKNFTWGVLYLALICFAAPNLCPERRHRATLVGAWAAWAGGADDGRTEA
jgi:hypothetical protein